MSHKVERKYWDVGEATPLRPTSSALGHVMNAIILCDGRIHDTYSMEIRKRDWLFPARSCSIMLRVCLPVGAESDFERISGMKLSVPPEVGVN